MTVWDRLREYAATQTGSFTSQEAITWFRRHAPAQANERTVRTHLRGACWNVGDRSQFASKEPFLTRVDRGVFRPATVAEVERWRKKDGGDAAVRSPRADAAHGPPLDSRTAAPAARPASSTSSSPMDEWHSEANIQAALVTALAAEGWRILSVANTATKQHGIDVIASRAGQTIGVEVKGYPSRHYADPTRADEPKRTSPSTQAGHWYAQAVLAAMRLRGKEPSWRSIIVLPDFPRYRALHSETAGSLTAAGIEVWWVDDVGAVRTSADLPVPQDATGHQPGATGSPPLPPGGDA